MRAFVAILKREFLDRRMVFVAAAIASLVPFAVPIARGLSGPNGAETRQWIAVFGALAFAGGLSIALGATTLASDIGNRRIAFYFDRPIAGWSLWAGKVVGSWWIAIGAAAVMCIPTYAVDRMRVLATELPPNAAILCIFGPLALVLVSHAASVAVRSRLPLLAGDLIVLGVVYVALRGMSVPLMRRFYARTTVDILAITKVALALGILIGGAAAVLAGRTQIRRAHRVLSTMLWTALAAGLLVSAGYSLWVLSSRPTSITRIERVDPGDARDWVTLMGEARTTMATFAFNVRTGRYAVVPTTFRGVAFSRDGRRAAWIESSGRDGLRVVSWDLAEPRSKPTPTTLDFRGFLPFFFLSPDGTRLVTHDDQLLSVYEMPSGRLLVSARAPGKLEPGHGVFVSPDLVRIFLVQSPVGSRARIRIAELDVPGRLLRDVGEITGDPDPISFVRGDGSAILVRDRSTDRLVLYDGSNGRLAAVLADGAGSARAQYCFLSSGRTAVATDRGTRLRIVTAEGQIEREESLPKPVYALLGEPTEGIVSLEFKDGGYGGSIGLLSLASGTVRDLAGLHAISRSFWGGVWDLPSGDWASGLFLNDQGSLVRVDPLTLERRVVIAARSR